MNTYTNRGRVRRGSLFVVDGGCYRSLETPHHETDRNVHRHMHQQWVVLWITLPRHTWDPQQTALAKTTSTRRHQKLSGQCRLHTVKLSRLGSTVLFGGNSRNMIARGACTNEHGAKAATSGSHSCRPLDKRREGRDHSSRYQHMITCQCRETDHENENDTDPAGKPKKSEGTSHTQ